MQKSSLRKVSILGLVLMAAGAVTAAVMPADKQSAKFDNGSLTQESTGNVFSVNPSWTCEADTAGGSGIGNPCDYNTNNSGTTADTGDLSSNQAATGNGTTGA